MNPRPPLRAGHGNRRRRPPAQAAARRHARWLLTRLRRAAVVLGELARRVRPNLSLRDLFGRARSSVRERGRALAPVARQTFADLGERVGRGATASGRGLQSVGRRTAAGVLQLRGPLRRGGRALLRGLVRVTDRTGRITLSLGTWLWRHRSGLGALALRALWWGALALLWFGGTALFAVGAPLASSALPFFVIGVGLCLPLFFVRAVRLRWAGFGLGLGHAALAALVWTVAPPA